MAFYPWHHILGFLPIVPYRDFNCCCGAIGFMLRENLFYCTDIILTLHTTYLSLLVSDVKAYLHLQCVLFILPQKYVGSACHDIRLPTFFITSTSPHSSLPPTSFSFTPKGGNNNRNWSVNIVLYYGSSNEDGNSTLPNFDFLIFKKIILKITVYLLCKSNSVFINLKKSWLDFQLDFNLAA